MDQPGSRPGKHPSNSHAEAIALLESETRSPGSRAPMPARPRMRRSISACRSTWSSSGGSRGPTRPHEWSRYRGAAVRTDDGGRVFERWCGGPVSGEAAVQRRAKLAELHRIGALTDEGVAPAGGAPENRALTTSSRRRSRRPYGIQAPRMARRSRPSSAPLGRHRLETFRRVPEWRLLARLNSAMLAPLCRAARPVVRSRPAGRPRERRIGARRLDHTLNDDDLPCAALKTRRHDRGLGRPGDSAAQLLVLVVGQWSWRQDSGDA